MFENNNKINGLVIAFKVDIKAAERKEVDL